MTGQELLDYLRTDILRDVAAPNLWSDALIMRRLNEAERAFCRETYALLDDTQSITTSIGTKEYAMPLGVLYVFSMTDPASGRDLMSYTRKFLPNNLTTATGNPKIFTMDEATHTVRLFPVPEAVINLPMRLARLPAADFDVYGTPEIPVEYHIDLAEFVAWRCLQDNDADGESTNSADRHKADWANRLATAKREYYRYRLGSNPRFAYSCTAKRN